MYLAVQQRIAIAVLIASFCLFALSAWKPLQLDNMDFPAVAKQTASTGLPVYYRGENNPNHLGLYHPPLYIYLLALWVKLLGFGETHVRMFGFLCALCHGWVVLALVKTLFGNEKVRNITGWFWCLFLLNPYTLQSAAICDIDSTIYGPLLCGALLLIARMSLRDGSLRDDPLHVSDFAVLCIALLVILWAKLTSVLLLPPVIWLSLVHRLGWRKATLATILSTFASLVLFLLTYFAYGGITGLDVRYTFAFTVQSFLRGAPGAPGVVARLAAFKANFFVMIPSLVAWTGVVPWIASVGALFVAASRAHRYRDQRFVHSVVLVAFALFSTAYYCAQTRTFGGAPFKYTFVYWAIIVSCAALILDCLVDRAVQGCAHSRRSWTAMLAVIYFLSAFAGAAWVRDRNIISGVVTLASSLLFVPAMLLIAGLLLWRFAPRIAIMLMCIGFFAWAGSSLGVAVHQSRVSYSTTYDYGQTGFDDAVSFVRVNTKPDEVIVSMKDIGFKAGRRYIENYGAIYGGPPAVDQLVEAVVSGRVRYLVFTAQRGQDNLLINPRLFSWVTQNCVVVYSPGDYRIYSYTGRDGKL
jgi:hypothetical protein